MWYCMDWCGTVRGDVVLYGVMYCMEWCGIVWSDVVLYGVMWYCMGWCSIVWVMWYCMGWCGILWRGVVLYGMVCYGKVCGSQYTFISKKHFQFIADIWASVQSVIWHHHCYPLLKGNPELRLVPPPFSGFGMRKWESPSNNSLQICQSILIIFSLLLLQCAC